MMRTLIMMMMVIMLMTMMTMIRKLPLNEGTPRLPTTYDNHSLPFHKGSLII